MELIFFHRCVLEGHEPNFLEDFDDVIITIFFIDDNFVLRVLHFLLEDHFVLEGDSDVAPVDQGNVGNQLFADLQLL